MTNFRSDHTVRRRAFVTRADFEMIDNDLAELYGVTTSNKLKQANK